MPIKIDDRSLIGICSADDHWLFHLAMKKHKQADLARAIGMSRGNLCTAIKGRKTISDEKFKLLCQELGLVATVDHRPRVTIKKAVVCDKNDSGYATDS